MCVLVLPVSSFFNLKPEVTTCIGNVIESFIGIRGVNGLLCGLPIQRSRVQSPALPDFLSSSGSGTGSTQPREVKLRSYLRKKVAAPGSENRD